MAGSDLVYKSGVRGALTPYRLALAGQRGHSGIYLEDFDDFLPEPFLRNASPYRAEITSFSEDEDGVLIHCNYDLKGGQYQIFREIRLVWPDEVLIKDQVTVVANASATARQRFIFDPSVTPRLFDNRLLLQSEDITATLFHLGLSTFDDYKGEAAHPVRGWCSLRFAEKMPTAGVDFVQKGSNLSFVTAIKLAEISSIAQFSTKFRGHLGKSPVP